MGRRAALAVRIDDEGTLRAELGGLPARTRRRAAVAVRAVLRAVVDADEATDAALSEREWEAAWLPEIERRVRDLNEGKATLVPADVALRRLRSVARGAR